MTGVRGYVPGTRMCPGYKDMSGTRRYRRALRVRGEQLTCFVSKVFEAATSMSATSGKSPLPQKKKKEIIFFLKT